MVATRVGSAMAQATVMISGNVSPSTETISLLKNRSRRCRTRSLNCFCPATRVRSCPLARSIGGIGYASPTLMTSTSCRANTRVSSC